MPRRPVTEQPASSADDAVDRLYSLDPDEFTGERNEAAKRLRAEGDKAGSDAVKNLRKPTAAAWAVNQLSRRAPKAVGELLEAGAALRSAQRAALSGKKGDLRVATQRRRAVVARLVDEAAAVFRDAGRNPEPHVDAIRSTLEAAATDEATGDLVRIGRVAKEVGPPSGFGDISPFEVLAGGRASPATDEATGEEAREESPGARRLRERLEARVAKAEDAVAAAREKAAEARGEANRAAKEVDRLERELQTARRRADRAEKAAATSDARAEDSAQALTKAQADFEAES